MTRKEALVTGEKQYYTGRPCARGHFSNRLASTRQCLQCVASSSARWRAENPAIMRAIKRAWRVANPTKVKAYKIASYQRNREANLKRMAIYAADNVPARRVSRKRWEERHPEQVKAIRQRIRSQRRGAEGAFTAGDVMNLYTQQEAHCAACGCSLKDGYHIDHIRPLARGGSNFVDNIQLLCPRCNFSKGAKMPALRPGRAA